ncbi:CBS domain-containing protein [Aestuariibacter halophilus]|uniref:CBS domain-containing protein n=1 Tax=Fluctibacter halophilus TaxID=226011 RepID=A0ABS8G240_9ALTE|nr:CBS domain-containing protein [Aestuariibacter halophilus]MCC2614642.1 CBS domain-containing protein [Aestuariibacter halophilus]
MAQARTDVPTQVSDIMTRRLVKLTAQASLADAHQITREKGIRHLPVVDPLTGKVLAIVTQKSLVAKVISLLSLYGSEALAEHEQDTSILEVAVKDFDTAQADDPLIEVAPFFLRNKHGCLPVVDDKGSLIGMVTSSDFVKLSAQLLEHIGDQN